MREKKIAIFPNPTRDLALTYTKKITQWLENKGYQVYLAHEEDNMGEICQICEFAVILGGDGSILANAKVLGESQIPVLGINLGSVGYLTDVEKEQGIAALERCLAGNYRLEHRMLIETTIEGRTFTALNDICFIKGGYTKIITLDIHMNGEYIDTYRADGIIISTPTGSTAYNLAAGGPIIKPDLDLMVVTPICPHRLNTRPFVMSATDTLTIETQDYDNVLVSIDGISVQTKGSVTISKSNSHIQLIRTSDQNFHQLLRTKLSNL